MKTHLGNHKQVSFCGKSNLFSTYISNTTCISCLKIWKKVFNEQHQGKYETHNIQNRIDQLKLERYNKDFDIMLK